MNIIQGISNGVGFVFLAIAGLFFIIAGFFIEDELKHKFLEGLLEGLVQK